MGALCSLLPLSIHFSLRNSETNPSYSGTSGLVDKSPIDLKPEPEPTSVASGVVEKVAQITDLTNSLEFPIPVLPDNNFNNFKEKKSAGIKEQVLFNYHMQSPTYLSNFFKPDIPCNEVEIAGQVFDQNGLPLNEMIVIVEDTNSEKTNELIGFTGTFPEFGPAGYLIKHPLNSPETIINIQLFNPNGETISEKYTVNLYTTCEKNLTIVNFYFDDKNHQMYFPLINH